MDANMISQVVKNLQRNGLLDRSEDAADRRAFRLTLTPVGETLLIAARERLAPICAAFFAPLGDREQTLAEMLRLVLTNAGGRP
jgi:DNA-binding MarR family transcriptional regulator